MKLKFTHKTWYFFLLCAAAASMLNGFAVLGGMDFSFLEMVASPSCFWPLKRALTPRISSTTLAYSWC